MLLLFVLGLSYTLTSAQVVVTADLNSTNPGANEPDFPTRKTKFKKTTTRFVQL